MKVEMWPVARVRPYENNPRNNEKAVDAVAKSLREFGWRQPLVVDSEGVLIVGHTRLKAAKRLALTEVPVHVAGDLTPEQIKAYRVADNSIGDVAGWDMDALRVELSELPEVDWAAFGLSNKLLDIDAPDLAETIAAASEYVTSYDEAETRARKITERLDKVKKEHPGKLAKAKAVILSANSNDALFLVDEHLKDFLAELRRLVSQGVETPLKEILNAAHRL